MPEPITDGIGLGFLGSFLQQCFEAAYGHAVVGEAHDAYRHLLARLKKRIYGGRLPPNHDLRHAIEETARLIWRWAGGVQEVVTNVRPSHIG